MQITNCHISYPITTFYSVVLTQTRVFCFDIVMVLRPVLKNRDKATLWKYYELKCLLLSSWSVTLSMFVIILWLRLLVIIERVKINVKPICFWLFFTLQTTKLSVLQCREEGGMVGEIMNRKGSETKQLWPIRGIIPEFVCRCWRKTRKSSAKKANGTFYVQTVQFLTSTLCRYRARWLLSCLGWKSIWTWRSCGTVWRTLGGDWLNHCNMQGLFINVTYKAWSLM